MNSFKNTCIIFVLFFMSGCVMFTSSVSSEIEMDSQSIKEFDLTGSNKITTYDGRFTGTIRKSSNEFKQYLFPTALKGEESRNLMILIPQISDEEYGVAKITETKNNLTGKASAKLIIMSSPNLKPNDFLNKNKYYIDLSEYDDHSIIIRKPYSGVEFDKLFYIRRRTGENISWREIPTEVFLDWNIRDADEINSKKLQYFYTIPLDVITSPIQIFLLLTWVMWD